MLTCEVNTSLPVTTNLLSVQWMHRGGRVNGGSVLALNQGLGAGGSVYMIWIIIPRYYNKIKTYKIIIFCFPILDQNVH